MVIARLGLLSALCATGCLHSAPMLAPPVRLDAGALPSLALPIELNGDRNIDLVLLRSQPRAELALYFGRGNGELDAGPVYPGLSDPHGMTVGDLNGDGRADIVVADLVPGAISIFGNTGQGALGAPQHIVVGGAPTSPKLADVNGDGKLDILVVLDRPNGLSHEVGGKLIVLLGHGDGNFDGPKSIDVGEAPRSLTIADFNRDGKPDVAIVDALRRRVLVLMGDGAGNFQHTDSFVVGYGPVALIATDVNRDGIADLVVAHTGIGVYLGVGDGRFVLASEYNTDATRSAWVADLDGDGQMDIVTARRVFRGDGTGHFIAYNLEHNDLDDSFVAVTDLNGDGKPDVIATDKAHHQFLVHLNNGAQ